MTGDNPDSKFVLLSKELLPQFKIIFGGKNADREDEVISGAEFIALKSFKARGKRLTTFEVKKFEELEALEPDPETIAAIYGEDFNKEDPDPIEEDMQDNDDEDDNNPEDSGETKEEKPSLPDIPMEVVDTTKKSDPPAQMTLGL